MKASEDFFIKVLTAYVVAAAKEILKQIPAVALSVDELACEVVKRYTRIMSLSCDNIASDHDQVLTYSCEVITLGLLWHHYHDATREGDGTRVLLTWKFLLLVFKASNRSNYSKEAAILLAQHASLFSERKAVQLLYSRFINTHGRAGCNIPCDLHIEHLNRRLKTVLQNLQSNVQVASITRAAKSIGVVHEICQQFEKETSMSKSQSGRHKMPMMNREVNLIVEALTESPSVLDQFPNRCHKSFTFKESLLQKFDREAIEEWMIDIIGTHVVRCKM